jgi:hypothetical protein
VTLTEVLWASLPGLILLDRGGRLRPEHHDQTIELFATDRAKDMGVRRTLSELCGAKNTCRDIDCDSPP